MLGEALDSHTQGKACGYGALERRKEEDAVAMAEKQRAGNSK
jgi:hypothetical protein